VARPLTESSYGDQVFRAPLTVSGYRNPVFWVRPSKSDCGDPRYGALRWGQYLQHNASDLARVRQGEASEPSP